MQYIKKFLVDNIWLLVILAVASCVYFYKISTVPNGFYIDEALPAYNAYSILKTGNDEYGKFLPIVFRFYGSYNPALYTYLTVIPVLVFGLNIFSARFISVVCGLLFSVVVYIFFQSSPFSERKRLAVFGAIISAISPWIIFYSRIGYEVTLGLLLFSFGAFYLWKSLDKSKSFVWSILFLSLSTYAAYTERFIVPALLIGFFLIFKKTVFGKSFKKDLYKGVILALITQIPNIYILFTPAFFPKTNLLAASALTLQSSKLDIFFPHFLANSFSWLREFLSQYFEYFSPRSLFFYPDPDLQRSIPALSVFYLWMVVPYFFGVYYLWKNKTNSFVKYLFLLLLVSPIPAALTRDPFATHRALPLVFPLIGIITLGVNEIREIIKKRAFMVIGVLILIISGIFFWRSYFIFLPNERAYVWQYGFDRLATEIKSRPEFRFVIDQARLKPSYINLAFYLKYSPEEFQKSVDQNVKLNYYSIASFNNSYNFGQIETRNIDWKTDPLKKQILVGDEYSISDAQAKEHNLTKIFEIRDPSNRIIFEGFETH